jgi:hypothetical protein
LRSSSPTESTRNRRLPAAAAAAAALGYALVLLLATSGYAIDDTWIHLQFARNLTSGLGPRFLADAPPVYACSSPLWTALLSIPYLAGLGGITAARMLSSAAAGAAAFLAWVLAGRRHGRGHGAAAFMLVALNPWMIRWGSSGMEASAAAASVLLVLLLLDRRSSGWAVGSACGLAFLLRPELAVLGPSAAAALASSGWGRKAASRTAVSWAIVLAAWEVAALCIFGRLTPTAAVAKVQHGGFPGYLAGALRDVAESLAVSDGIIVASLAVVVLLSARFRKSLRTDPVNGASVLACVLLLAALLLGRAPVVSRYLLPLSPMMVVTALSALPAARRGLQAAVIAAGILVQAAFMATVVGPYMGTASANLGRYMEVAHYLRDSIPDSSTVAVQEIGIFEYESGVRLLDLGGLVSTQVPASGWVGIPFDARGSVAFLRSQGVDYYLDPHGAVAPLADASDRLGASFVPLRSWVFEGGTSLGGETYTRVLYRIEWM